MLGFSVADVVAIVTLISGLALTVMAVRKAGRDPLANLPEVHSGDTLIRTLKAGVDGQTKICRQLERLADAAERYEKRDEIDREVAERLRRERQGGGL